MEQHIYAAQSSPLVRSIFSGLLHQRELSERLYFIKSRILNGYGQEEMAFLLGRSSHFIKDYEELANVALDGEDMNHCAFLFKKRFPYRGVFDSKMRDMDISQEKRILRGLKLYSAYANTYQIAHPWTVHGVNKPIVISEMLRPGREHTDELRLFRRRMQANVGDGYLDVIRAPMEVYTMLSEDASSFDRHKIGWLKRVLYEMVHAEILQVKNCCGRIYFKRKC